tara:strand:+ start:18 stop:212 length:195 start_codon:yes stop_codon:yes gene_type:complete
MDAEHFSQSKIMDAEPKDAKYFVTLKSGRTFVLNSGYDVYQAAYDAYEEACLHDDYLVDAELIE